MTWLNFEAVVQLASAHPDWRFIFIGPTEVDLAPYQTLSNLHLVKPYHVLANYVAYFDAGLIPFRLNELTVNVNPVKLYEYFALGKPVVATRLPELLQFEAVCRLASNTREFVQQVELTVAQLLDNPNEHELKAKRRAIAQANTWNERSLQIVNILQTHLAGQSKSP